MKRLCVFFYLSVFEAYTNAEISRNEGNFGAADHFLKHSFHHKQWNFFAKIRSCPT